MAWALSRWPRLQAHDLGVLCLRCCSIFPAVFSAGGVLSGLSRDLGIGEVQAALAVSAASLERACSVLAWSLLADRLGRLRTMNIAVIAAVLLGLVVPLSPGFEWLLALRFIEWLPAVVAGMLLFTAGCFAAHAVATRWIPVLAVVGRAQAASLYNLVSTAVVHRSLGGRWDWRLMCGAGPCRSLMLGRYRWWLRPGRGIWLRSADFAD